MTAIDESVQSARVRELRAEGLAPKQIARTLGLRPTDVIAVLNQSAATSSSVADPRAPVRCWVRKHRIII